MKLTPEQKEEINGTLSSWYGYTLTDQALEDIIEWEQETYDAYVTKGIGEVEVREQIHNAVALRTAGRLPPVLGEEITTDEFLLDVIEKGLANGTILERTGD